MSKKEKIEEAVKMAEEGAKLAASMASGNAVQAAKSAIKLHMQKRKTRMIKMLIKILIPFIMIVFIAAIFFGVLDAMKKVVIDLFTEMGSFIGRTWQWMTDDYWIKLDEPIKYLVDDDTDEMIGAADKVTTEDLQDEDGNARKVREESYTILDYYLREVGNKGVSIQALRLLGDNADYSDPENLLKDEKNKAILEKYIGEFVRADIITQEPHKRRGRELVEKRNQNYVDGGVYFYRTKKEPVIDEDKFVNGSFEESNVPVTDKDYNQMTFIKYEEFKDILENQSKDGYQSKVKNLRYKFTIDPETSELVLAKITIVEEVDTVIPTDMGFFNEIAGWLNVQLGKTTTYSAEEERIPYKEYIAKYTMPYEFLINLCNVTQNPEFVYHVALLARETYIKLAVQDNVTMERETVETLNTLTSYSNSDGPDVEGASVTGTNKERKRKVKTTTVITPVLMVDTANTWSFYEEFEFTKNVKGTLTEVGPIISESKPSGDILTHVPGHEETTTSYEGVEITNTIPEHWEGTFVTRTETSTQLMTMETTFNEPMLKKSIEKSKQFLGLLRNDTGKCSKDCFTEEAWTRQTPLAAICAEEATFNEEGINVSYRIPNMTRMEQPYSRLVSGVEMLYAVLQSNSIGYNPDDKLLGEEDIDQKYNVQDQYVAIEDYESAYVVKMQGLAEHIQYLMTFPPNEDEIIDIDDYEDPYEEVEDEDDEQDEEDDDDNIPEFTWDGTTDELIEMLGKYAHEDMQESGILASVTVAQALLESGWGKSQLSAKYNNYFGIKKGSGWNGPTVKMKTKEVVNGKTITVTAEFRVYDSPLESIKNHSKVLSASRYSGVKGEKNYRTAITIIKRGGYATDPGYVNKICKIIEQYGLTRFDK